MTQRYSMISESMSFRGPERYLCCRNLVYNSMEPSGGDLATDCARLCQARQRQRRNRERMVDIDEYRLIYLEPADSRFVPLAQEIAKLGLGSEYARSCWSNSPVLGRRWTGWKPF